MRFNFSHELVQPWEICHDCMMPNDWARFAVYVGTMLVASLADLAGNTLRERDRLQGEGTAKGARPLD